MFIIFVVVILGSCFFREGVGGRKMVFIGYIERCGSFSGNFWV